MLHLTDRFEIWHRARQYHCAKFQTDWTIGKDVLDERDFATFEFKMSFRRIFYIAEGPSFSCKWIDKTETSFTVPLNLSLKFHDDVTPSADGARNIMTPSVFTSQVAWSAVQCTWRYIEDVLTPHNLFLLALTNSWYWFKMLWNIYAPQYKKYITDIGHNWNLTIFRQEEYKSKLKPLSDIHRGLIYKYLFSTFYTLNLILTVNSHNFAINNYFSELFAWIN